MSSENTKSYQRLATIMASDFSDGGEKAIAEQLAKLPTPGNDWQNNPPPEFPMPWASAWGQDEYGLWCGFSIEGVVQRMRWIPPGEFWMGSPENEADRDSDEIRHRVKLTKGYWLAETACCQALWQAVQKNPSKFKEDDLPVENINWMEMDIVEFCEKLNKLFPELNARLPSEAEWEYACRAGTDTVFWWGDQLSTNLANYNGNHPYNNGAKGEHRNKTLSVNSFFANPWGLYQVHGNVLEWCNDWFGEYAVEQLNINPIGKHGLGCVLRGGSWFCDGLWLRAAFRHGYLPDLRSRDLGFRLAAGSQAGGAEAGASPFGKR